MNVPCRGTPVAIRSHRHDQCPSSPPSSPVSSPCSARWRASRSRSTAASPTATTALRLGGEDYVLRICGHGTGCSASTARRATIARDAAAAEHIAPAVVAFARRRACLVTRFVAGGAIAEQVRSPGAWRRSPRCCAPARRRRRCRRAFDVFASCAGPARARRRRCRQLPQGSSTVASADRARRSPARARAGARATTTCWPPTSSATARRVWIVDWEYAGMDDRYFDLGNLSVNNGFEARRRPRAARAPTSASRSPRGASRPCS